MHVGVFLANGHIQSAPVSGALNIAVGHVFSPSAMLSAIGDVFWPKAIINVA